MKNTLLVILGISICQFATGQKTKPGESAMQGNSQGANRLQPYQTMYNDAMSNGDAETATAAVYLMMATDSSLTMSLKDSLTGLYYIRQMYGQVIKIGKEILATQPDNPKILELVAVSQQNAGDAKNALETYEHLYSISKNVYHLYQIATLQYQLERVGECNITIDKILVDPDAEKSKIAINVGQNYQQQVTFKAAALNIRGVIAKALGNDPLAKKCFEDALAIDKDFILAKGNLDDMNKSQENKTPAPPQDSPNH